MKGIGGYQQVPARRCCFIALGCTILAIGIVAAVMATVLVACNSSNSEWCNVEEKYGNLAT